MSQLTRYNSDVFTNLVGMSTSPAFFIKPLHGEQLSGDFKVDIKENKLGFNIRAQIPGVHKEDIHVSVDGVIVTIQAEIKQLDEKTEGERVVRSECYYGSISRSFQLPVEADSSGTKAHYENGVLHLNLPKRIGNKSKQINVT